MQRLPIILATACFLTLLGGRVYHFVFRPEWTEPQALREQWLVWTLGVAFAAGAIVVSWVNVAMRKE